MTPDLENFSTMVVMVEKVDKFHKFIKFDKFDEFEKFEEFERLSSSEFLLKLRPSRSRRYSSSTSS